MVLVMFLARVDFLGNILDQRSCSAPVFPEISAQVLVMCIFGLLMSQSISQVALLPPGAQGQQRMFWDVSGGSRESMLDITRGILRDDTPQFFWFFSVSVFGGELFGGGM